MKIQNWNIRDPSVWNCCYSYSELNQNLDLYAIKKELTDMKYTNMKYTNMKYARGYHHPKDIDQWRLYIRHKARYELKSTRSS